MLSPPPKIDLLPEHLIDQIKAGEVIERPGNLLKEILENAIDAGATRLELIIKNNGLDLISLKDNGHGIRFEDLPLAFSRHATSKITRFEDIYRLHSFGFRGEALASISSISRLQCITTVAGAKDGAEIRFEGAELTFHGKRLAGPVGTELIIQDLFYNTPARLKFIQSQNSEKQFIKKILYAFILSNPGIEFQVKVDNEEKNIFALAPDVAARIKDILPRAQDLILESRKYYENYELELYLIPGNIKAPLKWQYLFINNRFVLDKQLHRVISNSLQLSLSSDDYHYVAFLCMPGDNIDINVHPNKTVIKFLESSKIIGLLTSTIKEMGATKKTVLLLRPNENTSQPQSLDLDLDLNLMPSLPQERHEYNLEGHFSPHGLLPQTQETGLQWIGDHFFLKEGHAFCARRLLAKYVASRMKLRSPTTPLLVSEPYPSKGITDETLARLEDSGIELERMGPDTIVLRGIPDWMNGFPLKNVISSLLFKTEYEIRISEWSSSTWAEMINSFPLIDLIEDKVAIELLALLKEKFR